MADDHNQRAYRSGETSTRSGASASGNDPLAELARLIGQNDPFGEYGRNNAGRSAAEQANGWPADTATYPGTQPALPEPGAYAEEPYANGNFGRQSFGSPPLSAEASDMYDVNAHAPGYAARGFDPNAYSDQNAAYDGAFPPSQESLHDVHQQFGPAPSEDYYDDVAPSRRRISIAAIAGVFALAVIGTAGALGYRAVFGPSSAPTTPPVIKADATPSKVVPAAPNKDSTKVTDRVGGNGQIEQLLSRQEQPVPVATTPNNPAPSNAAAFPAGGGAGAPAMGSGVVGEARKIKTITIRPDQAPDSGPASPPIAAAEPVMPQSAQPPARVVNTVPAAEPTRPAPQPRAVAPQAAAPAPAPQPQAAAPSNAPLSLSPNAAPARPARVAAAPAAPAAAPAAAPGGGGYAVQLSSQRSEGEAQAAFQSLQGKYPNQLGGRQAVIRRVDLGDKGIYYRAMVPAGTSGEANELCSGLKAAGGSCIVQRN